MALSNSDLNAEVFVVTGYDILKKITVPENTFLITYNRNLIPLKKIFEANFYVSRTMCKPGAKSFISVSNTKIKFMRLLVPFEASSSSNGN